MEIGQISCPEIGFLLCQVGGSVQQLGQLEYSVGDLAVRGPLGRGLSTHVAQGV